MARRRLVIMGAAGRDFHNFNIACRDAPHLEVVAFTATQIPGIDARRYPAELAGPLYPQGIPILPEADLEAICRRESVDAAIFAYSDVTHEHVMHTAARAAACGCDFELWGPDRTMLDSRKPVVSVTAVRTGCGKSQVSRYLANRLAGAGIRAGVIRHPMPYGDLGRQAVQRFAAFDDFDRAECTIEEREEYEPYVEAGLAIFAGADYQRILAAAEAEADVVLWDGGNNDFGFVRPTVSVVLVDALRPGHETRYWPGEVNLRMADIVVIAKADAARPEDIAAVSEAVRRHNAHALVIEGASPVRLEDENAVRGKRVLVVEDGPTITHGGMATGAGYAAALTAGPAEILDPRHSATPAIAAVYRQYPHIGPVLPAVGYSPDQQRALAETIRCSGADVVVAGTPIDLAKRLEAVQWDGPPVVRARYAYADRPGHDLWSAVAGRLDLASESGSG
ncbi:MAG: GTPase [Alphaproteobacteria bacterium]|nr:GTPase [Alphaproteobacteria bacterium]MCB9928052.1 GTPase [Alphaproteobacteria bacterium]